MTAPGHDGASAPIPPASSDRRILSERIGPAVLRFGAPLALGMGLQTTFNLVDAYVIARLEPSVAEPALGALGICDQLSAIGTIVSYGLTTASAALIAQAHGRRDRAGVHELVWQSLLAVLALSLLFGAMLGLFAGPILSSVVGAKGRVAELGAAYLRVNAGGAGAMFLLLQITGIQRALGSAKVPAALLVLSNVLNLFLAVLLVYGPGPAPPVFAWGPPLAAALHLPRLELVGAAWATVLARAVTLIPLTIYLARGFDVFSRQHARRPDRRVLASIWTVAWPSSTQLVVRMGATLLTHSLVARAFTTASDTTATTALGVVFRMEMVALFVAMGWGSAAQTFVGQNLGAGQVPRARESGWAAAAWNALVMAAIAAAFLRAGPAIIAFFVDEPHVVAISVTYLRVVAWSYLGLGTGVVLGSAITGAGATRITLLTDLAVVVGIQIPASLTAVLAPGASLDRLFWAVAATYWASGLVYVVGFRYLPWTRAARGRAADVSARGGGFGGSPPNVTG